MKMKTLFVAISFLLLFASIGHAQQDPTLRLIKKSGLENALRLFWEDREANIIEFLPLNDPEVREALGISDEQHKQMRDAGESILLESENNPEIQKVMDELKKLGNPFTGDVSEETMKRVLSLQNKMLSLISKGAYDAGANLLTPEQKQKIKEALLASMSEIPIVSPGMFEVLGLTGDQKQQMEKIKKELEPEYEKIIENLVDNLMILEQKHYEEHLQPKRPVEEMRGWPGIADYLMAEDPEYKKIRDEIATQTGRFSTQLNLKMFDVLTDEQWTRLQQLIDNPPGHARVFVKKMKEHRIEDKESARWILGAGLWEPGEAIPEQYRRERNARTR